MCVFWEGGSKDPLVILCSFLVKLSGTGLVDCDLNLEFRSQTVTLHQLPNLSHLIQIP